MITLLNEKIILTKENEKTNVPLSFDIEEDFSELQITYSYLPKILEDIEKSKLLIEENIRTDAGENFSDYPSWEEFMPLKNLITLSLDSPKGYMGAAHRQADSQHHIISEEFSSVGFERTEITKGKWTVTLNVHALVTENAECLLKVGGVK